MCVLAFRWAPGSDNPLLLAGNRDELHDRPAAALDVWRPDRGGPAIVGGRDLEAGGTWLGVTGQGRFAVITNFREPDPRPPGGRSRGDLVVDALGADSLDAFADQALASAGSYAGYNLIFGEPGAGDLRYLSNRGGGICEPVAPGPHGLSNHLLDTPWPKVRKLLRGLEHTDDPGELIERLADREAAADEELPDTGVGEDLERLLSAPFIVSPRYGTRASTVVRWAAERVTLWERRFDPAGEAQGEREALIGVGAAEATVEIR